jgi:hypothetical protein
MSTSIIDGTIEEIDIKRARGGISVYNSIRFKLDDGSSRTITKQVASGEVADALNVGANGRFYAFSAFDIKGIHGFRSGSGEAFYKFPGGNNAKLFVILGLLNVAWVVLRVMTEGDVPLLGALLMVLAIVGYVFMSKGARETKEQFEQDGGFVPQIAQRAPLPG